MKTICFIVNPISGVGAKNSLYEVINALCNPSEFKVEFAVSQYAGHAKELAREAVESSVDYVVAVGGDGTVNEVAQNVIHTPVALGIVPAGSGNGLARDLRIPLDMKKAIGIILKGSTTRIDYCKANEHIFFCTCGVGFDALVSERFSAEKHRGSIAYMKNVIQEYAKFHPEEYEIVLDDEIIREKAFLITCANASQYGYNAYIAPNANIRDGKVDIAIMSPIHPVEAGPMAIQLFTKQIDKNSRLTYRRSHKVLIRRSQPGFMHVDGTPVTVGKEITVETFPKGLNVIVPLKEDIESPIQSQLHDIQSFFQEFVLWIEGFSPLNKNPSSK